MKNPILQTLLALFVLAPAFSQKTQVIYLDKDAYTSSAYPTTNYGNAVDFRVENLTPSVRSYLQVDLASIPSNVVITKAELFVTNVVIIGSNQVVFNKVTSAWNETSITHNVSPTVTTTGQKSATISGALVSVDITDWVQEWYTTPTNLGICIGPGPATAKQTYIFNSSESSVAAASKPYVRVTYYDLGINWTNVLNGFTISGNTISNTTSPGGANSFNVLTPNTNGGVVFKPGVSTATTTNVVGLSDPATPANVLYGMNITKNGTNNNIAIRVNGVTKATYTVPSGTLCRIERVGNNLVFTVGTNSYTYVGTTTDGGKRLVVYAYLYPPITITDVLCSFANQYNAVNSSYSYTPSKTSTKNYILTTTPRTPVTTVPATGARTTTAYNDDIQYFDGLGRLEESISLLASPTGKDIVSMVAYDEVGRQDINFLPYTKASNNGAYISYTRTGNTSLNSFYASGNANGVPAEASSYLKNITDFEASPLNRVEGTLAPGAAWSAKPVSYGYATNTAGTIIRWKIDLTSGLPITEAGKNFYDACSLYVNQTTDEDGRLVKEYKDKLGQVIMKDAAGQQTYYVYDDFGLLRCVIPPKALAQKSTSNGAYYFVFDGTKDPVSELLYKYTYDSRQRMISKKIPGADEVRMVYDARDRLVLVQDGKLRAESTFKWMFTKYDQLNRPVLTGIVTINGKTADDLRLLFANEKTRLYETPSPTSNILHTPNNSYPSGLVTIIEADVYTITYYDSYPSNTSALAYTRLTTDYDASYSTLTKNKVTATKVRAVVDAATGFALTNSFTATNYYYDKYGRGIGSTSLNYIGLTTKSNTKYDFTNAVTQSREQVLNGATEIVSVSQRFVYDHRNRLLETYHKVNNDTEVLLAQNIYNELGQLLEKRTGLTNKYVGYLQYTDYAYNIRGWLKKINNSALSDGEGDLFGMELYYESTAIPGSTAQYNGNISNMVWKNKTNTNPKSYRNSYDNLNRLKSANYAEGTSFNLNTGYNNESYTYDVNGNIATLTRIQNNIRIDTLAYNYLKLGNKLQYIVDLAPAASKASGFNDRNTANTTDYEYDANGNLKKDLNKLMAISSNYLNLPSKISSTTTGVTDKIEYLYNAQGAKLAKKVNGLAEEEHYMGNLVIKKNGSTFTVNYLLHSEGLVTKTTTAYVYEYFAKDHLGNTRVKYKDVNGVTTVQQATDYYPFGLAFTPITPNDGNKYLYNGKELQDNAIGGVNLDWYDYGARMYDAQLGRWHVIDKMAENHFAFTPYNYVLNNPLIYVDLFGLDTIGFGGDIEEVYIYGTKKPTGSSTLNTAYVSQLFSQSSTTTTEPRQEVEISPQLSMIDASSAAGFILKAGEVTFETTGLKLGQLSGNRFRMYGANFNGNQSTKIVKLAKPVKIGGNIITFVVLSDRAYNVYFGGLEGAALQEAQGRLIEEILMTGVYAINAELGLILTGSQILVNSEDGQRALEKAKSEVNAGSIGFQLPQGPTYIKQGP